MKLVASLIVKDELSRYLVPCIDHLLPFVDEIRVVDDGSTDGTLEYLGEYEAAGVPLHVRGAGTVGVFEHEGDARQRLLDWTLEAEPTHILAIDGDEFVTDGALLRHTLLKTPDANVFTLTMEEVWKAFPECLCVRYDGGWHPTKTSCLYRVPPPAERDANWRIRDLALAPGREPSTVKRIAQAGRATETGVSLLHFGWANEAARAARHARYVEADGGRYHRSSHLNSIIWPDERVEMESRSWPVPLVRWREMILARSGAPT